jgi:hypothetical protein
VHRATPGADEVVVLRQSKDRGRPRGARVGRCSIRTVRDFRASLYRRTKREIVAVSSVLGEPGAEATVAAGEDAETAAGSLMWKRSPPRRLKTRVRLSGASESRNGHFTRPRRPRLTDAHEQPAARVQDLRLPFDMSEGTTHSAVKAHRGTGSRLDCLLVGVRGSEASACARVARASARHRSIRLRPADTGS